jgi:hypothetical protein
MFRNWLNKIDKTKVQIRVAVCSLVWAKWNYQIDIAFNKTRAANFYKFTRLAHWIYICYFLLLEKQWRPINFRVQLCQDGCLGYLHPRWKGQRSAWLDKWWTHSIEMMKPGLQRDASYGTYSYDLLSRRFVLIYVIAACLSFLLHAFVYVTWTGRVHLVTTEALTAVRMWAAAFYFRPGWVSVPFTHIFVKSSMCDVSCRPHNFLSSYSKRHTTCVEHATSSSFCHLSLLRTCLVQGC